MTDSTPSLRWFVVQARSNFENQVAEALRGRVERLGLTDRFGEILVPSETVVSMKDGQKRTSVRKFFPGYVLVQIAVNDPNGPPDISVDAWHAVKETPKVLGFIGGSADRPLPISDAEAQKILKRTEQAAAKPSPSVLFEQGQAVRITDGPFKDFDGFVESFDAGRLSVRVNVMVFGRATPVEFSTSLVEAA